MKRHRRYDLIKRVFTIRAERLHDISQNPNKYHPHAYGIAVGHYDRARKRWRKIRGWQ